MEMGSSVVTGITFTKLVGVTILARAPSQLFRLYYFRECHFTAAVCGLLALGLQTLQMPTLNPLSNPPPTRLFTPHPYPCAGIYLGIIVMGAFHGLALLPVLLATFGLPG